MRFDELVTGSGVHVVRAGDPAAPAVVFLHGWPQSALAWSAVLPLAAGDFHAVALDLPGIGGSTGAVTDGSKAALAEAVHGVIRELALRDVLLVGHDVGGMVAYSYLRAHPDVRKVVILDVVVPGVEPWEEVLRNPRLWHFALHAVPGLPELLVRGNQAGYFDFFYDALTVDGAAITPAARAAYAAAYSSAEALTAGFDWYRAFPLDAERNAADTSPVSTPVLYLRGEAAMARTTTGLERYADGLRRAGLRNLTVGLVPGAAHFVAEEAPGETWRLIAQFAGPVRPTAGAVPG